MGESVRARCVGTVWMYSSRLAQCNPWRQPGHCHSGVLGSKPPGVPLVQRRISHTRELQSAWTLATETRNATCCSSHTVHGTRSKPATATPARRRPACSNSRRRVCLAKRVGRTGRVARQDGSYRGSAYSASPTMAFTRSEPRRPVGGWLSRTCRRQVGSRMATDLSVTMIAVLCRPYNWGFT